MTKAKPQKKPAKSVPKPKCKPRRRHSDRATASGGPFGPALAAELVQRLQASRYPRDPAERFVASLNSHAVCAYRLEPGLSSLGQSRRWFRDVATMIGRDTPNSRAKLLRLLREASTDPTDEISAAYEALNNERDSAGALSVLREHCLDRVGRQREGRGRDAAVPPRRGLKVPSPRASLANWLVREWRMQFEKYPGYRLSLDKAALPPFLRVLKDCIQHAEKYYPRRSGLITEESLKRLVRDAVVREKRRRLQEP